MSVFSVVRPIVNPIVRSIVNPRGGGFAGLLNLYPGAAAAYSLRALSSGWLAGDVVEVRRSSDSTSQDFTASQITNGDLVSFVNNSTWTSAENSTSQPYTTFTGASLSGFTATLSAGVAFGGFGGVSGVSGQTVSVSFDLVINSGSPSLALRTSRALINTRSNSIVFSESGSYTADLNATDTFGFIGFSEGDNPSDFTISNFEVTGVSGEDGFVSTWYDQSGNANDATQITTTAQPKIVDAGALVTGGLEFDGVDDWLETASAPMSVDELLSVYSVATFTTTTGRHRLVGDFINTGSGFEGFDVQIGVGASALDFVGYGDGTITLQRQAGVSDITAGSEELYSVQLASGTSNLYINSDLKTTRGSTSMIAGDTLKIGGSSPTIPMDGAVQEIILYNTDQSANRAAIEANINDFYSIY